MRIDVLPLRNIPSRLSLLSYETDEPVVFGQLVDIPFRKSTLTGVVWNTASRYTGEVALVTAVRPNIVCTAVQQSVQHALETSHAVIPASLFAQHFPANRILQSLHIQSTQPTAPERLQEFHWYTDRLAAVQEITKYRTQEPTRQTCLIVPTEERLHFWHEIFPDALTISSATSAKKRNEIFRTLTSGSQPMIIGTSEALFLPYTSYPHWIVDEEDHASYKLSQAPYLDVRRVLDGIPGRVDWFSAAPTLRRWHLLQPRSTPSSARRMLGRLDQGTNAPWISWEAESAIRELAQDQIVVLLIPRKNFARKIGCRSCGWSISCQSCGSSIRWSTENNQEAICSLCGNSQHLPITCERCHQPGLQTLGLDAASLQTSLDLLFPDRRATTQICAYTDVLPATTALVVHVSGDALLHYPDVASEDRAYQTIQGIVSQSPHAQHIVQTYEPSFRLWQLWSTNQDVAWYTSVWQERVDLGIPPGQPGMIARYRGPQPIATLEHKKRELEEQFPNRFQVLILPVRKVSLGRTPLHRLLITSLNRSHPVTNFDWKTIFPHPWAVDMAPDSWIV